MAETEVDDKKIIWTVRPQVSTQPVVSTVNTLTGFKVAAGQQTSVAASDTVVTGLTTVLACMASYDDDPADANTFVSCSKGDQAGTPAAGSILVKTWKSADGADVTPIAATSFSKKVNWIAIGI